MDDITLNARFDRLEALLDQSEKRIIFLINTEFFSLNNKIDTMAKTQQEIAAQLDADTLKLDGIKTQVQDLKNAASGNPTDAIEELQLKADGISAGIQELADLLAGNTTTTPPVDQPPVDVPPVDQPPIVDVPPVVDVPTTDNPTPEPPIDVVGI